MIIVGLLFFMVVVMAWKIGAVEVLSLIMFIGFAVDYCLHIAHKFQSCSIHDVFEELDDVTTSPPSGLGRAASFAGAAFGRPAQRRVTMIVADTTAPKLPSRPTAMPAVCKEPKSETEMRKANKGEERFERAKFALEKIGPSVLGSGLTTLGSAAFLLPCSLHVFYRIGAVVCGITVYAEFFALLFLPALLMIIGPAGHDFQSCLHFRFDDWIADPLASSISAEARIAPKGVYVLNAPVRGMAQVAPGELASRTKIMAQG